MHSVNTRDLRLERMCSRRLASLGVKLDVKVEWSNRLKTTSGLAYWRDLRIVINAGLLKPIRKLARRVVLHELAHFLAWHRAGNKPIAPHGPEWRMACRDVGIPGELVTHSLPVKRRKMKPKHFYGCPSCGKLITRVRPYQKPNACLVCCKKHSGGKYDAAYRLIEL
jgi:predicted SprT family Zn-dependent metalloprotease